MCRRPASCERGCPRREWTPPASLEARLRVWTPPLRVRTPQPFPSPRPAVPRAGGASRPSAGTVLPLPARRPGPAAGRPPGPPPFPCQGAGERVWASGGVGPRWPHCARGLGGLPPPGGPAGVRPPVFHHLRAAKSGLAGVLSGNRVFPPVSGLFTFLFLDLFFGGVIFVYLAALGLSCGMWNLVPGPGPTPEPPALGE